MQRLNFTSAYLAHLRPFLLECDRIKFANVPPEPAGAAAALALARQLIQAPDKRRLPEPAPVAAASETGDPGARPSSGRDPKSA